MHNTKFAIRSLCNRNGLAVPELPEIPPNPFSEVPAPAVPLTKSPTPAPPVEEDAPAAVPTMEEEIAEAMKLMPASTAVGRDNEKAGPGPYQEPTAEQIQSVILAAEAHRASLGLPMACCDDCIHPSHHHHSTADLDQRDRFLVNVKVDLTDDLRRLMADADAMLPPWLRQVQAELLRARAKFPTAEHRTLALMEEAGEVVKAALDLHNRKPGATLAAVHAEIIQTMAMCVRLLEEGDPAVLGEDVA